MLPIESHVSIGFGLIRFKVKIIYIVIMLAAVILTKDYDLYLYVGWWSVY